MTGTVPGVMDANTNKPLTLPSENSGFDIDVMATKLF